MSELWDKKSLVDYLPSILSDFKGDSVNVEFYHSSDGSVEIEISEVKNKIV